MAIVRNQGPLYATPSIVTDCGDPQSADHTPSGRGVCLIFSSYMGPLTTMTGSELAGHRLLVVLVAPCCGTALLARRGGPAPPLNRPPPPGAPRLLPPPRGAGSPWR